MFLQVRWPNQQCQSTEGGWLVIQMALNLTRLISPCHNNTTCMHADTRQWHTKKSKHSEWTQWDEAKSGRLNLWAAPMIVQLYEATQYYYYRAILAIFPLTPDQIRAQIWPNGVWGGGHYAYVLWRQWEFPDWDKLTCRRPVSDVAGDVDDSILSPVSGRAETAAMSSAYRLWWRRHWVDGNVSETHADYEATTWTHAQPHVGCVQQHVSTNQGPNLQNFVKCTYENVTRELRIVS